MPSDVTEASKCGAIALWLRGEKVEPWMRFIFANHKGHFTNGDVIVPDYYHDDHASGQLLDEMAAKRYSVHQWTTPMGTHVTIEPWTNTDEFPGYDGGYLADTHDPDRKRAIAEAAWQASKA